jgi:hypothetical protein
MMTTNILEAVQALIPDHVVKDVGDNQVELHGDGGLILSVMFDIKPDMTTDYTKFCCAPLVYTVSGERQLGHWHNWPFDDMYMAVEPFKLQEIFQEVNDYKV